MFNIRGALKSTTSTKLELVNNDYTIVTLPDHVKVILKLAKNFWIMIKLKPRHCFNLTKWEHLE